MAAIDGVGETHPQMPLNASMFRLRASEIDIVASTEDTTINNADFSLQERLALDDRNIFGLSRYEAVHGLWVRPEKID